ncbi:MULTISPECIES: hypothetical protein [unclassified Pseudomonas]|uniref:hypothetical protein n=1 Tax=unclassified Pseudomonas TaxID=196821 RepID=UPI000BDA6BF2|nr:MULTISPECIES: hypothetical protein [unclassified Pseudomonas]PVZ19588.1 hypothetical protein F474_00177 [Pseudomonas sp. URIL14HWK12:I12]PVZ22827.1 hypothetical protein F470_03323 [Pseudomonas sp. URIL14HWK12:I10]PVZ37543.1 hypothetical protein F472_00177 [Pseudomonas sp. URIL14HWK12:I11]SNZ15058.1 hypothetical protein SAMN05660463_02971 [Pseudomonas sp. URIL14HWK12:I9]
MNNKLSMFSVLASFLAYLPSLNAAPADSPAVSVQTRLAPCYERNRNVNCEVSGVARVGHELILANDKHMPEPGDPAMFSLRLGSGNILQGSPAYLSSPVLDEADKYEGLTTTLDGKYVVAITAFNKEGTQEQPAADALNTLLYWPVGAPQDAKVVSASARGQVVSSRGLRERISRAVKAPYYQIEALSTAPGERLLIGIRKYGENSKNAVFSFLLLSVPFKITEHGAVLGDEFDVLWQLTPDDLAKKLGPTQPLRPELGLSALEFDRHNGDRFYATTSFENGEKMGGYLWVLPYKGGAIGEPRPVRLNGGTALVFNHKPEGVEALDEDHVLVVHDDDRVRVKASDTQQQREAHEFAYEVVSFSALGESESR